MTVDQLRALLTGLPGDMPVKISDWNGHVYEARHVAWQHDPELPPHGSLSAKLMQEQDIIGWEDNAKFPDEDWFVLCADK